MTSTGSTVITGNLGVSPGTAITGFSPGIVNGFEDSRRIIAKTLVFGLDSKGIFKGKVPQNTQNGYIDVDSMQQKALQQAENVT